MGKQRNQTLIERLGFQDGDLRSPAHDAMVLWIAEHILDYAQAPDPLKGLEEHLDNLNQAIASSVLRKEEEIARIRKWIEEDEAYARKPKEIADYVAYDGKQHYRRETPQEVAMRLAKQTEPPRQKNLEEALAQYAILQSYVGMGFPVPAIPPAKVRTDLEYAVSTDRQFIVGFVDVQVYIRFPYVAPENIEWSWDSKGNASVRGLNKEHKPPGLSIQWHEEKRILLEAKPSIPSLGELLRQIRTYQEYISGEYVVVSPDTRFRTVIEQQGIKFWESPSF